MVLVKRFSCPSGPRCYTTNKVMTHRTTHFTQGPTVYNVSFLIASAQVECVKTAKSLNHLNFVKSALLILCGIVLGHVHGNQWFCVKLEESISRLLKPISFANHRSPRSTEQQAANNSLYIIVLMLCKICVSIGLTSADRIKNNKLRFYGNRVDRIHSFDPGRHKHNAIFRVVYGHAKFRSDE